MSFRLAKATNKIIESQIVTAIVLLLAQLFCLEIGQSCVCSTAELCLTKVIKTMTVDIAQKMRLVY